MRFESFKKGFSLLEIIIVIGIFAVLISVASTSLFNVNKNQGFEVNTLNVISIFNEVRSLAMSSQDFSNYGVHLTTTSITSFEGDSFDIGINKKEYLIPSIAIFSYNIFPTSNDIIFNKVTGETNATGTLTLASTQDTSKEDILNLYKTGVLEIQK